jgi:hypothetical protein
MSAPASPHTPPVDRPPHAVRAAADRLASFHALRTWQSPAARTVMKALVVEHYGKDGLDGAIGACGLPHPDAACCDA